MRKSGFSLLTTLVVGVCALPSAAFAQDAPAAPPAAAAPAAPPAPGAPGVAPATPATAPAAAPAAAPPPTADTAAAAPPAPPAEAATPPAPTYPSTTITGFVEGGYNHVFGAPHPPDQGTAIPTRAYDPANGFVLHLAHVSLKHQLNENVYGVIEIDAGADARYNHDPIGLHPSSPTLFDIQEAYGVATGSGFTFTAGKFATYEGIEVIEGPANPTISRGLLYWLAEPVTHVGAKLHYTSGPVDVGVGVVNGWDTSNGVFLTGDDNNQKTFIFRAAVTPSPMFFAALSGTYGVEKPGKDTDPRYSLDLTGAAVATPNLTINFQANLGGEKNSDYLDATKSATWVGFGIQPVVKVDAMSLGLRFEYFNDKGLSRSGLAGAINPVDPVTMAPSNDKDKVGLWNLTITPGYTIASAMLLRAEFRVDGASEDALWAGKKNQETISLGASYMF